MGWVRRNKIILFFLAFSYKSKDKKEVLNYMLFFSSPNPPHQGRA